MSHNHQNTSERHHQDAFARWGRDDATEQERQDTLRKLSFYMAEPQVDPDKTIQAIANLFSKIS